MSKYWKVLEELEDLKCSECDGSGYVTGLGFETWECPSCEGTGFVVPHKLIEESDND